MRVDGTGDAVQIPALALVVADFSELVVGPIIGNWESQITREPRRHIGDEGGTCVAGIDDTAADVARSVDAHTITASEGLSDSLEVRQDIAGHLVIGRIEVYSEVDMGGRDAKALRRLTSGLGMSSAVCRGEMFQLRGVLLKNREEPHAALSDALELTRTDGLKVILGRQRRLARLRQITSPTISYPFAFNVANLASVISNLVSQATHGRSGSPLDVNRLIHVVESIEPVTAMA